MPMEILYYGLQFFSFTGKNRKQVLILNSTL